MLKTSILNKTFINKIIIKFVQHLKKKINSYLRLCTYSSSYYLFCLTIWFLTAIRVFGIFSHVKWCFFSKRKKEIASFFRNKKVENMLYLPTAFIWETNQSIRWRWWIMYKPYSRVEDPSSIRIRLPDFTYLRLTRHKSRKLAGRIGKLKKKKRFFPIYLWFNFL